MTEAAACMYTVKVHAVTASAFWYTAAFAFFSRQRNLASLQDAVHHSSTRIGEPESSDLILLL